MEALLYEDASFDLVTAFTSFFFADDMVAALREAARVAKPGAPVVIQGWGAHERCDLEAMKGIARPFFPPRPPDATPIQQDQRGIGSCLCSKPERDFCGIPLGPWIAEGRPCLLPEMAIRECPLRPSPGARGSRRG